MSPKIVVPVPNVLIPRRTLLRNGLAGLAAAMASRAWMGCGDDAPITTPDGGPPDTGTLPDAGPPDSGRIRDAGSMIDGGPVYFPPRVVPARPALVSRIAEIGALGTPDANGLRLATGFSSRVIARNGEMVAGTTHTWHIFPDGGATFITEDGGWIYTSNSEMVLNMGGVGAIRFAPDGTIRSAYRILDGTSVNCAGGPTPWHTWLSCEEIARGRVFECDPWGEHPAVARPALGVFEHEAAAIDPDRGHVYLSEDAGDGRFYRFVPEMRTPEGWPDLNAGTLEVAVVTAGVVTWRELPDPRFEMGTPTRQQIPESTAFRGGEGIWYQAGIVYLSTKGDNRIWAYDAEAGTIEVLYDGDAMAMPPIVGVDNITVSASGDVLVAEDGGSMQIVAILPSGETRPLIQLTGHDRSEITGPAFDPSGTRLYFSSQRGPGSGTTFEVTGPFHAPA
jgi:hypothetical protein